MKTLESPIADEGGELCAASCQQSNGDNGHNHAGLHQVPALCQVPQWALASVMLDPPHRAAICKWVCIHTWHFVALVLGPGPSGEHTGCGPLSLSGRRLSVELISLGLSRSL